MIHRILKLGIIVTVFAVHGCSNIEDRVPVTDKISIDVPAAYNFLTRYPPIDSHPVIHLQTYEWYPNTCYWLSTSVSQEARGRIIIYVGDAVSEGGSCGAAFIQAEAVIPIDTVLGSHDLVVVHGDSSDHYEIKTYSDRTQLVAKATHFTVPTDSVWWKVPPHSLAMTCQYSDPGNAALCEEIIDSVFGKPWITQIEIPSFGVWPYPPNASVYQYRGESDLTVIKRLLDSFEVAPLGQPAPVRVDILTCTQERYSFRIAS